MLARDRCAGEYIVKVLDMVDQEVPQGYETGTCWIAMSLYVAEINESGSETGGGLPGRKTKHAKKRNTYPG